MPFLLNLLGQKKLKISSKYLQTHNVDSSSQNALAVIANPSQAYGLIVYENVSGHINILKCRSINTIDIQITDENNNLIDFNGHQWLITLRLINYRLVNFQKTSFQQALGIAPNEEEHK